MSAKTYLVPHDFTDAGAAALEYAISIAKRNRANIYILHIVKRDSEKDEAKKKLIEILKEYLPKAGGAKLNGTVQVGDIFKDIASTAEKVKAELIIMGTHGAKGMQKVTGSFALKVVQSTKTPFLIVQKGMEIKPVERIIFPVNVDVESLQIMQMATYMARLFGCAIHLIAPSQTDNFSSQKIKANMTVVAKKLKKNEVKYVTKLVAGSGSFYDKTMDYTKKNRGGMLAISMNNEGAIISFNKFAQNIITNEAKIPALIVHARSVTSTYF